MCVIFQKNGKKMLKKKGKTFENLGKNKQNLKKQAGHGCSNHSNLEMEA